MQARIDYESHHFAAARDRALALTRIEPGKSRAFALLGDALLEFGDLEEAAKAYQEMQKRKGDPVETETRLARLELTGGRSAETFLCPASRRAQLYWARNGELVSGE